jgi:hypothetical protein
VFNLNHFRSPGQYRKEITTWLKSKTVEIQLPLSWPKHGQLIQQLLSHRVPYQQSSDIQHHGMVSSQRIQDLSVRPSYDWQPLQLLFEHVLSLSSHIFKQTLSDDERKAIVERYPAIQGLKYTPPPRCRKPIVNATGHLNTSLCSIQYTASTILVLSTYSAMNFYSWFPWMNLTEYFLLSMILGPTYSIYAVPSRRSHQPRHQSY